jgi:hypothetical protein
MRTETKAFIAVCLAALTLSFLSLNTLAQSPGWDPATGNRTEIYDPWKKTDQQWYRALERPRSEDRVVKKGLLAPAAQDRTDYATFLKGSDTGLIRLLPDPRAHASLIRGGGSYYSFHYLSHEYGSGTDIQLQRPMVFIFGSAPQKWLDRIHDSLAVGFAGDNYGMMTNLGNVPLGEISAKDPRARFLATYEPPRFESDARCQAHRFVGGEMIDGRLYKKSLPVQVGATYLLRSINYDESDVLVALRVARQDDDGSVIIAWKMLKDFRPRKLENINVKGTCN